MQENIEESAERSDQWQDREPTPRPGMMGAIAAMGLAGAMGFGDFNAGALGMSFGPLDGYGASSGYKREEKARKLSESEHKERRKKKAQKAARRRSKR